jgi:hypothetical protein
MDIICITGAAPGLVSVTVSHQGQVRQLPMEVERHQAGGWRARHRDGVWGLRCHSVNTAVLLEAAEAFVEQPVFALAAD